MIPSSPAKPAALIMASEKMVANSSSASSYTSSLGAFYDGYNLQSKTLSSCAICFTWTKPSKRGHMVHPDVGEQHILVV